MEFAVNDRVYYADNGPADRGTVTAVSDPYLNFHVCVRWDDGAPSDWYASSQLIKVLPFMSSEHS